jgi:hypothetical protein
MKMSRYHTILAWLLALTVAPAGAVAAVAPPDDAVGSFFAALPGAWEGRAFETPVGPVDYPVRFHVCDTHVVAGVAELKVSDHYWYFRQSDDGLRLTFLSTFRGNREPTELVVSKIEDHTIWLYAPELQLLTLSLTLLEPDIEIRVFHHRKPHVAIRLTRSGGQHKGSERNENRVKGCKPPGLRQPE